MSAKPAVERTPKAPLTHLKGRKWSRILGQSGSSSPSAAASSSRMSPAKSPEPNCAICLCKIEDKSFTDMCFHAFCRTCLFEWSKVKPECPVCRQAFQRIIYNVRAMDDYEEHRVETERYNFSSPFMSWANMDRPGPQRFRYPTTLTPLRRRMLEFERRLYDMNEFTRRFHQINYLTAENRRHRLWSATGVFTSPYEDLEIFPPPPGTSAHRKFIYDSDLWVMTNGDGNVARTREVSHRFFAANPACTHRLIPWLNRELNALTDDASVVSVLIPRIMDALLRFDITSRHFKLIIRPYIYERTDHFIHEFYNFARSPYDMEHFSRVAVYVPKHRAEIVESEPLSAPIGFRVEPESPVSDSGSDSSICVVSPSRNDNDDSPLRIISTPTVGTSSGDASGHRSPGLSRTPMYASVSPASGVSSTEIRDYITPSPGRSTGCGSPVDLRINAIDPLSPSLPTPLPRGDLPDVNFNIDTIDFDDPQPGPSGISCQRFRPQETQRDTKKDLAWSDSDTDVEVGKELEEALSRFERSENVDDKRDFNNYDSDTSSVLVVGYVKPLHERTPEIIDLLSESEEDNAQRKKLDSKSILNKKIKKEKKRKHDDDHHGLKKKCKHKSKRHRHKHSHKHYHKRESYSGSSSSNSSDSEDGIERTITGRRKCVLARRFFPQSSTGRGSSPDSSSTTFRRKRFDPMKSVWGWTAEERNWRLSRNEAPRSEFNSFTHTEPSSNYRILSPPAIISSSLTPVLPSVIGYHNLPSISPLNEAVEDTSNLNDGRKE